MQKVLPSPSVLVTLTLPLCFSIMLFTILKPNPVPSEVVPGTR